MNPFENHKIPQKYTFIKLNPSDVNWKEIEALEECTCFHSQQWDNYVHRCGYKTFIAKIQQNGIVIGYFIGTMIGRFFKLICSPLDSLGYTQGIILKQPIDTKERIQLYQEMINWVFKNHYALYVSVDDWQLREDHIEWTDQHTWRNKFFDEVGLKYTVRPTLYLPMNGSTEDLWAGLHYKSAKYCINKARKLGLYTRVITNKKDIKDFLAIHYDQICDVCARHHTPKPKLGQSLQRLQKACEELFPDKVLMIQVIGKDENGIEQVMSSALFFIGVEETIYHTGASYQRYQKFCPNEIMVWEAICILKEHGVKALNFGGMNIYKLKFGTIYAYIPRIVFSKYSFIDDLRSLGKHIYLKYVR